MTGHAVDRKPVGRDPMVEVEVAVWLGAVAHVLPTEAVVADALGARAYCVGDDQLYVATHHLAWTRGLMRPVYSSRFQGFRARVERLMAVGLLDQVNPGLHRLTLPGGR